MACFKTVLVGSLVCLTLAFFTTACGVDTVDPGPIPTRTRRPTSPPTIPSTRTPIPLQTAPPTKPPTPEGLPSVAELGDTWVRPADGMVMVFVPRGTFQMGTATDDPLVQSDEIPQHAVTLSDFWIDQTEVTNAQFTRCVTVGACQPPFTPSLERHANYFSDGAFARHPVIYVSWLHAWDYCQWVGGALPTEAQWEYAARGSASHRYPWGDAPPDDTLANFGRYVNDPVAVGSYPQGASWCGALDMSGNVYEWVADWYRTYPEEAQIDPMGPDAGIGHVLRGGSWFDKAEFIRAANRYVIREAYRDYTVPTGYGFNQGFRCAVSP